MQRRLRLRGDKRFAQVYKEGRSWANGTLVIKVLPNELDHSRFGCRTGRRLGKAVVRNKIRRRLREAARARTLKPGWDIVVIARRSAAAADYQQLKGALDDLLAKADLLPPQPRELDKA